MTDTSKYAVDRLVLAMIRSGNTTAANMLTALAVERDAANARADQARDAALVEAKAAVGLVRVPVGSTGPIWDAMDAIDALRDKPAPAQCCMCGKTDLSTVEGDGGPECQLDDGRWTCSHACYDRATEEPAPAVTVQGFPPNHCTAWEDCNHDGVCHDPDQCGATGPNICAIAGGGDE